MTPPPPFNSLALREGGRDLHELVAAGFNPVHLMKVWLLVRAGRSTTTPLAFNLQTHFLLHLFMKLYSIIMMLTSCAGRLGRTKPLFGRCYSLFSVSSPDPASFLHSPTPSFQLPTGTGMTFRHLWVARLPVSTIAAAGCSAAELRELGAKPGTPIRSKSYLHIVTRNGV